MGIMILTDRVIEEVSTEIHLRVIPGGGITKPDKPMLHLCMACTESVDPA